MPPLKNVKHELFAQEIAKGSTAGEAVHKAGYRPGPDAATRVSGYRLLKRPEVRSRVEEIVADGAERAGITVERVIVELARIAFADIRNVARWRTRDTATGRDPETGGPIPAGEGEVVAIDSDRIGDDAAAAIAEVSVRRGGTVKVRLHDKLGALECQAKLLGLVIHRHEIGRAGEFSHLTDAQKRQKAIEIAKELGLHRLAQDENVQ